MKREGLKKREGMGVSSSDERQKVIWWIGREVDLLSEADEGK